MSKKLVFIGLLLMTFFSAVSLIAQTNSKKKSEKAPTYIIIIEIKFREKEPGKKEYEIESICPCGIPDEHSCPKGTSFEIKLLEIKLKKNDPDSNAYIPIDIDELNSYYLAELASEESKIKEVPVRTEAVTTRKGIREGPVQPEAGGQYEFLLAEAGKEYTVKITKYNSFEEKLKGEDGIPILQDVFTTYHRYHVGLDVGWFFPFERTGKSYSLFYKDPSVARELAKKTLIERRYYQTKAIVYVSIFPYCDGFEPERPVLDYRRLHLNIGTELSKSILDKLYLGLGYDFSFLSINAFCGIGDEDSLPDDYQNWIGREIPNGDISTVPLIKKFKARWGLAVSIPFGFATKIGKIFGL